MSPYLSPIYSPKRSLCVSGLSALRRRYVCFGETAECFEETICVFWGDDPCALRRRSECFEETICVFWGDKKSRKVLYIKDFYSRDL